MSDTCWRLARRGKRTDARPVTLGRIEYDGLPLVVTAELPWLDNVKDHSCINPGLYEALPHPTEPDVKIRLADVEGRDDLKGRDLINLEIANWPIGRPGNPRGKPESKGCIFPGTKYADTEDGVLSSAFAMKDLIECARECWSAGKLYIRIEWENE